MKYYIQVNPEDGTITDVISYPHDGYIEISLDPFIPDIHGGGYVYVEGQILRKPQPEAEPIAPATPEPSLAERVIALEDAMMTIMLG